MKKNLIPIISLFPVGFLSYMYNLTSFVLLAVIAICLAIVIVAGLVKAVRTRLNTNWFKVPVIIIAIGVTGIVIGLLRPLKPAVVESGDVSDRLAYAYKTDQADRMTIKAFLRVLNGGMAKRDSLRLEQVTQFYKDNQIKKPIDKFHAAFVFHHSKDSALYDIAQQLAGEAASVSELKDNYVVQWLAKATYDRWMVSLGKPQKYGTQDKFTVNVE